MGRKTLVALTISTVLILTLASARLGSVGAWGIPASTGDQQRTQVNNLGSVLGAPFRAIGKLFGGGKKKDKPISKITEKDIKKFGSSQVSRVKDATTPTATTTPPATDNSAAITKSDDGAMLVDHLQRGRDFFNAGLLNEAITELTMFTAFSPKSGEAQTLLGIAYDRKGLGALAREAFEKALQAPDDQAMHLNNLGFLLYRQGEFDDAIRYLKRAAKLNPDDTRVWNNLATTQIAAEKYDDAYKSSVHAIGEFESRMRIARSLEWRGFLKEAIKYAEKARALQPNSTDVLAQLATLYDNTGQDEKALVARQRLTTLRSVATAPAQK